MDGPDAAPGLSPEQRAAYRSFVRTHHPDRGGDPEVFRDGLARYRAIAAGQDPGPGTGDRAGHTRYGPVDDRRYDRPIEIVPDLPLPTRVLIALIRTARRRSRLRVDRPDRPDGHA